MFTNTQDKHILTLKFIHLRMLSYEEIFRDWTNVFGENAT